MKITSFNLSLIGFGFATVLMLVPVQTPAHHAFAAEFDINKPVKLTGTVTLVRWINPHGRIHIDVEDENGDGRQMGTSSFNPSI